MIKNYIGGKAHNVDVLSALVERNEKSAKAMIKYFARLNNYPAYPWDAIDQ